MMKSRISKWTAFLAVLVMALSSGASQLPSAQAQSPSSNKVVFTVGSTYDLVSPNPFKACCSMDYEMLFMNYDMLFNFNVKDLTATSGLASFPPQKSADGLTWTFHIQPGVKWSDGVPLTASDIAFTYNFIWQNHLSVFRPYLGDPVSFTAPNPTTFVWKMKTASLSPLTPPWIPIVPEHIWKRFEGADIKTIKEFPNLPAVGSGPFTLTQWKEGQYLQFEANKDYWGGSPTVDEVVMKVYDNNEALALALQTGEVDFAEALPPDIFNKVKTFPNVTTNVSDASYLDNLAFNFTGTANPALKNEQVRLAISYAIDRQTLVDRVLGGYGSIGDSMVLPTHAQWYWKPTGSEVQGYDPAKAKQLLDQAGYVDTNGDGIREDPNTGQPLSISLLTISDITYSVPEGNLIAGWLKAVGIDATTKTVNTAKAYDLWGAHDFDAYVWGWGGGTALILALVAAAPALSPHDPNRMNIALALKPPSAVHWFGTDEAGRDVLSRVLHGGRESITASLVVILAALVIGIVVGALAGLLGNSGGFLLAPLFISASA
jgi:peptide/nickel transport system substrate-binding protein